MPLASQTLYSLFDDSLEDLEFENIPPPSGNYVFFMAMLSILSGLCSLSNYSTSFINLSCDFYASSMILIQPPLLAGSLVFSLVFLSAESKNLIPFESVKASPIRSLASLIIWLGCPPKQPLHKKGDMFDKRCSALSSLEIN
jgi:hypothetical protein